MRQLVLMLLLVAALPAAAQQGRPNWDKGRGGQQQQGQSWSQEERRKLREDVNSARGDYGRQERQRQDRMAPEERERLRRDVQDANRDLRRR